jgi:hypothetical protein
VRTHTNQSKNDGSNPDVRAKCCDDVRLSYSLPWDTKVKMEDFEEIKRLSKFMNLDFHQI